MTERLFIPHIYEVEPGRYQAGALINDNLIVTAGLYGGGLDNKMAKITYVTDEFAARLDRELRAVLNRLWAEIIT